MSLSGNEEPGRRLLLWVYLMSERAVYCLDKTTLATYHTYVFRSDDSPALPVKLGESRATTFFGAVPKCPYTCSTLVYLVSVAAVSIIPYSYEKRLRCISHLRGRPRPAVVVFGLLPSLGVSLLFRRLRQLVHAAYGMYVFVVLKPSSTEIAPVKSSC